MKQAYFSVDEDIHENLSVASDMNLLKNEGNYSNLNKDNSNESEENDIELPIIEVSARNLRGIGELEDNLKRMFFAGNLSFNDEICITNIRHKNELSEALESLERVKESIDSGMPEDFYSIDLLDAYEKLGNITGETMGEDLVNEIFSKFCMGK